MDEFDRDPNDQNRRDILVVVMIIGVVLLLTSAWYESKHPRLVSAPTLTESPDHE